jgi:hypothetical protein
MARPFSGSPPADRATSASETSAPRPMPPSSRAASARTAVSGAASARRKMSARASDASGAQASRRNAEMASSARALVRAVSRRRSISSGGKSSARADPDSAVGTALENAARGVAVPGLSWSHPSWASNSSSKASTRPAADSTRDSFSVTPAAAARFPSPSALSSAARSRSEASRMSFSTGEPRPAASSTASVQASPLARSAPRRTTVRRGSPRPRSAASLRTPSIMASIYRRKWRNVNGMAENGILAPRRKAAKNNNGGLPWVRRTSPFLAAWRLCVRKAAAVSPSVRVRPNLELFLTPPAAVLECRRSFRENPDVHEGPARARVAHRNSRIPSGRGRTWLPRSPF